MAINKIKALKRIWAFPKPHTFFRDIYKDTECRLGIRLAITCIGVSLISLFFSLFGLGITPPEIFQISKIAILRLMILFVWVYFYFIKWLHG